MTILIHYGWNKGFYQNIPSCANRQLGLFVRYIQIYNQSGTLTDVADNVMCAAVQGDYVASIQPRDQTPLLYLKEH